ncbi:tRNA (N(6)-L-threonylcarbamoyladenosine(37)-C(2))-methylthiotransferase MtaB [Prolixibacteraceae bacterium JC049]|nr:tRNA (N(6)-L-threonylcarbamoyladenosine(37)-C(2))-methylthiotransferase MtaB [Prolixibacteraceae bacterium JC049]
MDYTGKQFAIFTLGCKLNFSESSEMAQLLEKEGLSRVDFKELADLYIIHSCSVTEQSDKKSRNIIRQAIRRNPKAMVIVAGCYAQLKPDAIAQIEGVDFILGTHEKYNLTSRLGDLSKNEYPQIFTSKPKEIKNFHKAYSFGDRTRSFLKVQDGCNYYCTYCTIPYARGISRNDTIENTVAEAKNIAAKGIKEVILTGVNIGDFGQSTNESFFDLVKALDEVEGIERFRISSIEPNLITDEIIEFVAQSKRFAPHFHIPLQSGSDDVLSLMKRRYKREVFAHRVEKIKLTMPHAFIGVDMIAGTNGETNEFFIDSYNFIRDLDVSQIHAFPYSERANTQALKIEGKVDVPVRKERCQQLINLSERKLRHFYQSQLGRECKALFEEQQNEGKMFGFTDNYVRVELPYNKELVNQVCQVRLEKVNEQNHVEVTVIPE